MSGPAQVRSTFAIEEFRAALAKFEQAVQTSLEGLESQVRRASDWIEHDRPGHWRRELHRAEDAVHQAKLDLERCLMFPVADERPSCREERAALRQAQERVTYCRAKIEVVRQWKRKLHHELFEYHGRVGQLKQILELDLPKARGSLEMVLRRLEEYRLERPPEAAREPQPTTTERPPAPSTDAPRPPSSNTPGVSDGPRS
jgi:exonuclease VII large subunit